MGKEIKGTTRVCGLIGNPVHHTLSPAIHNSLAVLTDTDMVYVPFEVQGEDVESAVKGALALDILGMNVTIPHKSAVIPYLSGIDPAAKRIGAVNTLVRTEDGKGFKGYNTDYSGMLRALENAGASLRGEHVIILGAGGVARPAAFLCAEQGAKSVYILNRTVEKAAAICEEVNEYAGREICTAMNIADYKNVPADRKYVCFQMTSVGLYPESDKAVIEDADFYRLIHTGFDGVYRPLKTRFIRLCEEAGAKTVSGLRMLLYQGVDAFELWNGVKIPSRQCENIYGILLGALLENRNIVLTGFMGSGKSVVSAALSKYLGYDIIDSDAEIERQQRTTISSIFENQGEQAFRDMETEYLKQLVHTGRKSCILSIGGGMPLREANRSLLKEFGKVVFLKATPDTVYDRIKDDHSRPLLNGGDVLERIKKLQDDRRDIYAMVADIEIDTDGKTVEEIAKEIIMSLV